MSHQNHGRGSMPQRDEQIRRGLDWLSTYGIADGDIRACTPCLPGEFMLDGALYVNSATPEVVYRGAGEGTLPLVAGRWYMIPSSTAQLYPSLRRDTAPVARAPRLIPS
jgi:hypothetical protein